MCATAYLWADRSVMAVDSLLLKLSEDCVWRDDGQVPSYPGMNYAYVQHRPITGQEELRIRGYDIARLKFTGIQRNTSRDTSRDTSRNMRGATAGAPAGTLAGGKAGTTSGAPAGTPPGARLRHQPGHQQDTSKNMLNARTCPQHAPSMPPACPDMSGQSPAQQSIA